MTLKILILLLQVALSECSGEVIGYIGDNITLTSGANTSLSLTEIEWSILSNNTFIATYRDNEKSTERFYSYKGRLDLNISTGDLMIYNLTTKDDMIYTVDFINNGQSSTNKVKLTVRKPLQKPNIQTRTFLPSGPGKSGCWIQMLCSSSDEGVEFSWQVTPTDVTTLNMSLHNGRSALLLAFINSTQAPATFTCTTSKSMEETWRAVAPVCEDKQTQNPSIQPQPPARTRPCTIFVFGVFIGFLTIVLYYLLVENRKKQQASSTFQVL